MWIVFDGLDRTGKSTVAELYKKKGFEVVHMSAPDKKYTEPGYTGPSYADDLLELMLKYDNKDVVFDRSWYGEFVWPQIYGRKQLLSEEDLEVLQEFEERNETQKILMIDPDTQAHWQRCVDNNEPLDQIQFRLALNLFNKLAHKYNFIPKQLKDFQDEAKDTKQISATSQQEESPQERQSQTLDINDVIVDNRLVASSDTPVQKKEEDEFSKLEKANAIRDILAKPILKPSKTNAATFQTLESDIRTFLKDQLSNIFKESKPAQTLSQDEVAVLKVFCQRLKEKANSNDTSKK